MDVLISPDALGKQAQLTYEGKAYKLLLAYRNGTVLTQASLMSAWNAVKLSAGNGYAEQTGTIGTGSWNSGNARYELPQFTMSLTASGSGFIYDAIVLQVDNRTSLIGWCYCRHQRRCNQGRARAMCCCWRKDEPDH